MDDMLLRLFRSPENAAVGSHPLTIAIAASLFWFIFGVLHYTECLLPRAKRLSKDTALEWNIRTVSSIHAIILVTGSFFCYWDSFQYSQAGNVFGYSFYPDFFARIFLGYLIYDLSNLSVFFKTLRDYSGIIHHTLFVVVTAYVLAYSLFKFPFVWLSFGEASTPFVNLRWRLAVLGQKESSLYVVNGVALACAFFLARVLANGMGLLHLWQIRNVWLQPGIPWGHKMCVCLFVVGYVLNLYWFLQIAKGLRRALSRKEKAHKV